MHTPAALQPAPQALLVAHVLDSEAQVVGALQQDRWLWPSIWKLPALLVPRSVMMSAAQRPGSLARGGCHTVLLKLLPSFLNCIPHGETLPLTLGLVHQRVQGRMVPGPSAD